MPAGEHTIVFNYYSSGLIVGEFISCITIIIATVIIILKRKKLLFFKNTKKNKWRLLNSQGFIIASDEKEISIISKDAQTQPSVQKDIVEEISDAFELNSEIKTIDEDGKPENNTNE